MISGSTGKPDLIRDGLAFVVNHSIDGTVRANVSLVLPLSQAAEADRLLEERQVVGAVVLDPPR